MTDAVVDFIYPDDQKTWGPDVSFYQDDNETPRGIDFVKMKDEGADFVIIRAGQNLWPDPDFKVNWEAAKEAGLLRAAYWFLDGRVSANSQALLFKSMLAGDPGELPPIVDYEHEWPEVVRERKGKTKSVTRYLSIRHLYGFVETLAWPVKPIIYTGYYYWQDHGANDPAWGEYPLWIATYDPKPMIPAPWKDWLFWQFTNRGPGKVLGAESNAIDLNYFHGTGEQLLKYAGKTPPAPPVETGTGPVIHGKTTVTVSWTDEQGLPRIESKESEF
jgi:lysozyme